MNSKKSLDYGVLVLSLFSLNITNQRIDSRKRRMGLKEMKKKIQKKNLKPRHFHNVKIVYL